MEEKVGEFYRNVLNDELAVTSIFTIHYFKYGKFFSFPSESHDFWELVFIDSGEAEVLNDKKTLILKQSQVFFHKPNAVHTISTGDHFCNSAIVSFECQGDIMKQFENKLFTLNNYERQLLQKIVFEGNYGYKDKLNLLTQKRMKKRHNAPFGCEQTIKNCLELLIISIARNNVVETNAELVDNAKSSIRGEKIVSKIIDYLNNRIDSSVNLDDIAKELYFSKTYIKSVFKKYTGSSIIQYYNKIKIDEAKRLISLKTNSFTEISAKLGFSSVNYFTRLFKTVTDMTPSEYFDSIQADNVLD